MPAEEACTALTASGGLEGRCVVRQWIDRFIGANASLDTKVVNMDKYSIDDETSFEVDSVKRLNHELIATADKEKKVFEITLSPKRVDKMFHVEGIRVEDFIQKFMESYGISKMNAVNTETFLGIDSHWEYTSPTGVKVTIRQDKCIILTKVAAAKEMTFN